MLNKYPTGSIPIQVEKPVSTVGHHSTSEGTAGPTSILVQAESTGNGGEREGIMLNRAKRIQQGIYS